VSAEPRIRVSAILRREGRILLCRHEKAGREYWLLPGGGVDLGESLAEALQRACKVIDKQGQPAHTPQCPGLFLPVAGLPANLQRPVEIDSRPLGVVQGIGIDMAH